MDVEALARLSNSLALEGVPSSLTFGEDRGEVLDARRTLIIATNASLQLNANHFISLFEGNLIHI